MGGALHANEDDRLSFVQLGAPGAEGRPTTVTRTVPVARRSGSFCESSIVYVNDVVPKKLSLGTKVIDCPAMVAVPSGVPPVERIVSPLVSGSVSLAVTLIVTDWPWLV